MDSIGYRRSVVASEVAASLGLAGLAVLPDLFADPFVGIMICVVIYAIGITSPRIPKGGTALFALLAMAGDLGGAFGPSLVGTVTQQTGDNLQSGMLVGSVFPIILIFALILLTLKAKKSNGFKHFGR